MVDVPKPPAGQRLSIRYVDAEGAHDVVGDLVHVDAQWLELLPLGRGPVRVAVRDVRAARVVPPRVVRPSSSVADLSRLAARGWPGLGVERLGGWELHHGDGFTARANSCLPLGEPGMEPSEALDAVAAWYRARGLRPSVQVAARSFHDGDEPGRIHDGDEPGRMLDGLLASRGWTVRTPSLVMVRDLRRPPLPDHASAAEITWDQQPGPEWLALEPAEHPSRVAVLTSAPADYATARLAGDVVGGARFVRTDDWVGVSGLFVTPPARGRGLGRQLLLAGLSRAAQDGARFSYLQVLSDNKIAIGLYERLGFTVHHRYHYRQLP